MSSPNPASRSHPSPIAAGLLLLLAVLLPGAQCAQDEAPQRQSVLIYGHGAALFGQTGPRPMPAELGHQVWHRFVESLRESQPAAVFALGDHARSGDEAEWQAVRDGLASLDATCHLIRGDQDGWEMEGYAEAGGGAADRVVDVGRNRFVLLDARDEYGPDTLQFLADALADGEQRADTFVLTHERSYESATSNWNRDVVPLLREAGVRCVFSGEQDPRFLSTRLLPDDAAVPESERLLHVSTGFCSASEGPPLYLKLIFEGDELVEILPRCVPIDLRHPWYHGSVPRVAGTGTSEDYGSWEPTVPQEGELSRLALFGHSYGLHVDNHNQGRIYDPSPLRALVDELNRQGCAHTFALGDLVFDPQSEEEWLLVEKEFGRFAGELHLTRGNHEGYGPLPVFDRMRARVEDDYAMVEDLGRDLVGKVLDLDRHRLVMLDWRNSHPEADLDFLDEALKGHGERAGTFFLTHMRGFEKWPVERAPEGLDPMLPYGPYGNFNAEVAPRLHGRVDYSFFGDLYPRLVGHYVSPVGDYYLCNGLGFRGDYPLIYTELQFRGDELQAVLPRVVPLDLRHEWYRYEFVYGYEIGDILAATELDAPTLMRGLVERLPGWKERGFMRRLSLREESGELLLQAAQRDHDELAKAVAAIRGAIERGELPPGLNPRRR